ncbi:hypothetical protein HFD88_003946 [Aspergillus terreus]|nr:hypothetical protein HFD88_003946 [Aspergillus terreus]
MRSVFRKGEPTIVEKSSNSADANENVDACGDLFKAAKAGNVPKIRELLDANPEDVDNRCKACRNVTPVIVAAVSGQQRAVEELCNRGANVEIRDIDGYTIIKLALDAGQRNIAEYLVCRYPDMTITDPRLPKGALWLEKEFWKMSNNISDKSSKPPKNVLDYLLTGDEKRYKPIKDRNVSEIYWEHILLRYIGDVPCDIRRNYSDELKMAFVGTFDRLLYKHCGIKESARLLNCVLPTTAYDVYGTHVASEQGWILF